MTKTDRAALICGLAESLKESVSDYENLSDIQRVPFAWANVKQELSRKAIVYKCKTLLDELNVLINKMEGKNVS